MILTIYAHWRDRRVQRIPIWYHCRGGTAGAVVARFINGDISSYYKESLLMNIIKIMDLTCVVWEFPNVLIEIIMKRSYL